MKNLKLCLFLFISLVSVFILNSYAQEFKPIVNFEYLSGPSQIAVIPADDSWSSHFKEGAGIDFAKKKSDKYTKDYIKAMTLMQKGKKKKAVDLMEKIAGGKTKCNKTGDAVYQLLFYKRFGSFDFHHNIYNGIFDKRMMSCTDFPTDYVVPAKNSKNKKNMLVTLRYLYFDELIPIIGIWHLYTMGSVSHSILWEFYKRYHNGYDYTRFGNIRWDYNNLYSVLGSYGVKKHRIERILKSAQVIPYLKDAYPNTALNYKATDFIKLADSLMISKKYKIDQNHNREQALDFYTLGAVLGEPQGVKKAIETALKLYPIDNESDSWKTKKDNGTVVLEIIDDFDKIKIFEPLHPLFVQLSEPLSEYIELCNKANEQEVAAKKERLRQEEARKRAEKEAKKAQRRERWANIGFAVLQGVAQATNQMSQQMAYAQQMQSPRPMVPQYSSYTPASGISNRLSDQEMWNNYLSPEAFLYNYQNGLPTLPSSQQMGLTGSAAYAHDVQVNQMHQQQIMDLQAQQQTQDLIADGNRRAQQEIENFRKIYGREPDGAEIDAIYKKYTQGYMDAYSDYVSSNIQANKELGLGDIDRSKSVTTASGSNNSSAGYAGSTSTTPAKTTNTNTATTKTSNTTTTSATTQNSNTTTSNSNGYQFKFRKVNLHVNPNANSDVVYQNCEIYSKGTSDYVKVGENYYKFNGSTKQNYRYEVMIGNHIYYFN